MRVGGTLLRWREGVRRGYRPVSGAPSFGVRRLSQQEFDPASRALPPLSEKYCLDPSSSHATPFCSLLASNTGRSSLTTRSLMPPTQVGLWSVILLAALAVLVSVVQSVAGVLLIGPDRSHDGAFAVSTLAALNQAQGWPLPRWSAIGNAGLGTPMFYFYPPGAYFAASGVAAVLPKLPSATILGLTMVLFRAGAVLTCALWLRRHVGMRAALVGGALYALMPYIAIFNPQVRFAFAEMAASTVLPLIFLAADAGKGRLLRTIVWIAPAIALMALVHLPTLVLTGGLVVAYAAMLGSTWTSRARQLLAAAIGVILGLGLAGATLVPAILLLKEVSPDILELSFMQPEQSFLFRPVVSSLTRGENYFLHLGLIAPILAAALGVPAALRLRGWSRAALVTLAIAVFLTLPISAPLWSLPLPLRRVQFPWRLLVSVSLFGAALATVGLVQLNGAARRIVLLVGVAFAAAWIGLAVFRSDRGRGDLVRTQEALASPGAYAMEYFPAVGGRSWTPFRDQGAAGMRRHADEVSGCPQHHALRSEPVLGGIQFDVSGCAGPTILPQLYFPGWSAAASTTPPAPDPDTGLVVVTVPEGRREIVLRRSATWEDLAGTRVSVASLIVWMVLAIASATRPRRVVAFSTA